MIGASLAIIVLMIVLVAMLVRAGRRPMAVFAVPAACIPAAYLLAIALRAAQYADIFLAFGLIAGVVANVVLSGRFQTARGRKGYIFGSCVFLAALFFAYLVNL